MTYPFTPGNLVRPPDLLDKTITVVSRHFCQVDQTWPPEYSDPEEVRRSTIEKSQIWFLGSDGYKHQKYNYVLANPRKPEYPYEVPMYTLCSHCHYLTFEDELCNKCGHPSGRLWTVAGRLEMYGSVARANDEFCRMTRTVDDSVLARPWRVVHTFPGTYYMDLEFS